MNFDKIKQYSNLICEQIRWKKAHHPISEEIENHIIDQTNIFVAEGLDELSAVDKAIEEMGDPIDVGSRLDRVHRPKIEWSIIALTISAIMLGLIINFFAESTILAPTGLSYSHRSFFIILTIGLGIICMIIIYFLDFTIIGMFPKTIFILLLGIMLPPFLYYNSIYNDSYWIPIPILGSVSLSYLMMLLPASYAGIIYNMRNKGYLGIFLCGVFYSIPAIIFLLIGQSILSIFIYVLVCVILLLFAIYKDYFKVKRLYGILISLIPTIIIFIKIMYSYRLYRFELWTYHNENSIYIPTLIKDMLYGAKFWGQGTAQAVVDSFATLSAINMDGNSVILPLIINDYLITYLIHKFGWVSFIGILIFLSMFLLRGFYLCFKQKSVLGKLISISVMLTLSMQILMYLSINLMGSQFFSQTLPLPFISYGGSAMISNLILIGILLSIFKLGDLPISSSSKLTYDSNDKFIKFADGKIIIDLKAKSRNLY